MKKNTAIAIMMFPMVLFCDLHIINQDLHITKKVKSWIEFKNHNLVRQHYDYSCGSASLATILHYFYDQNISEKIILKEILNHKGINQRAKELEHGEVALSFFELGEYAKTKGFKAMGLALDLESLKKLKIPVVLFVKIRQDEHFTVFRGVDSNYVYLADPSLGNIKVSLSKFKEMFYQRDDLKYPGKLLAILPIDKNIKSNREFMKKEDSSNIIYKTILME